MDIKKIKVIALCLLINFVANSQETEKKTEVSAKLGKGIEFKTADDLFYLKFRTRIQTRWEFENNLSTPEQEATFENKAYVKRARLKFDGHVLNKKLFYKIEYDVVGGYVRDAMMKYKMDNIEFWFGQGKLPSNRERVVSSANLQMVDRSIFNKYYTLDRDAGIQIHHKFKIGNAIFFDRWAITSGNGIKDNNSSEGLSFTGKIEVQPFGAFSSKGAYKLADLAREETPKLAIAAYSNFNQNCYKDRGQVGSDIGGNSDLLNFGGDLLFKYRGYSLMVEAGSRSIVEGGEFVFDDTGAITDAYYTGFGGNAQTGYVFKNNWEVSGRYAFTKPNETAYHPEITDYTFAVSKYIVGHNLKIQGDVTFREILDNQDQVLGRIQMEFQF